MKKLIQFVKDSAAELKKVVWPTREDVISSTKVVLISTIIFALVLGLVDFVFLAGVEALFR
ncbi:MAG: preprotein translocase subunit SecE [Spirochaetales bacterium]|jgi:preprotein translocase subunit SecE|nr:preprotein translocase subunit SecE [Spirochaetales bacterium]